MADYREAFVGIDVAKLRNAITIAEAGREGESSLFAEVDASATNMGRIIARIANRSTACISVAKPARPAAASIA